MTIKDFKRYFNITTVNFDTTNWHHDYFLALNDDGTSGSEGKHGYCGSECTRYTVTVKNTSDKTNKVHVSANTWRERSYPMTDECSEAINGNKWHVFQHGTNTRIFQTGEKWFMPFELGPGDEETFTVEWALGLEGLSRDWSVVAWGEVGSVKVSIEGKTSDHFPMVKADDNSLPADEGQGSERAPTNDGEAADNEAEENDKMDEDDEEDKTTH